MQALECFILWVSDILFCKKDSVVSICIRICNKIQMLYNYETYMKCD